MSGTFWLGMFLLAVGGGLVSLVYLIVQLRKHNATDGTKNLTCTFLLLAVIASVGVTSHADDSTEPQTDCPTEQPPALADFDLLYHEFLSNELRAHETYQGERYLVAATITDFEEEDALDADSEIQVSMSVELDGVQIPLHCSFSSEHWDSMLEYDVGDIVIFEGTCEKAWEWSDCEMI